MNKWLRIIGFIIICVTHACLTPHVTDKETITMMKQVMDDTVHIQLITYQRRDSMTIKLVLKNMTNNYIALDDDFKLSRNQKIVSLKSQFPIYLVTHDYFYKMHLIKPRQSVYYEWKVAHENTTSVEFMPLMCYSLDKIYNNYAFRISKMDGKKYVVITDISKIDRMYGDINGFSGPYVKLDLK
jgi:hypothetical protein